MSDVSDVQALENSLARQEELVAYIEKKKTKKKLVSLTYHSIVLCKLVWLDLVNVFFTFQFLFGF